MKKRYLKRIFDMVVSCLGIILFLPFFILIALLIKLERIISPEAKGPLFSRETRISMGKPFIMYKFRTVKRDFLEAIKRDPEKQSQSVIQAKPGALTSVGKLLARFYLDELPQLFNILRGNMSFVGPRPQCIFTYNNRIKKGDFTLKILKSGLCGLCQACKRNAKLQQALLDEFTAEYAHSKITFLDKIYLTKYQKYSTLQLFAYDLKIMLMTLRVNIKGEGLGKHQFTKT